MAVLRKTMRGSPAKRRRGCLVERRCIGDAVAVAVQVADGVGRGAAEADDAHDATMSTDGRAGDAITRPPRSGRARGPRGARPGSRAASSTPDQHQRGLRADSEPQHAEAQRGHQPGQRRHGLGRGDAAGPDARRHQPAGDGGDDPVGGGVEGAQQRAAPPRVAEPARCPAAAPQA